MRTTTVKDLGANLPIGVQRENALIKPFTLRPHTAQTDRLLNIWREANKGQHIGWEVCKYLSLIVLSIGDEAFPLDANGDSPIESVTRFHSMNFGDVMYLWLYARIMAVEEKCEVPYACPRCGLVSKAIADLWTTEVLVIDSVKETQTWAGLKKGFTLKSGKKSGDICLRPAPFSAFLLPGTSAQSTDSIGYAQIKECIVKVKGTEEHHMLADDELDTLPKMDWLRLDRIAGRVSGGPKMRTAIRCDGSIEEAGKDPVPCGNEMTHALDWSYDSFFDSSVPLESLTN